MLKKILMKILQKRTVVYEDASLHNYWKRIKKFNRKYFLKVYAVKYVPVLFSLMSNFGIANIIASVIWWLFVTVFYDHRIVTGFKPVIRIWFGVPGAGKTTMGAWLARQSIKQGVHVLSNVEIKDTYRLNPDDLGTVDMSFQDHGAHVIYDEGSIDFDNRNHSQFAKTNKPAYFALHRHMSNAVDVFSQGYDIDKRIRDRACAAGLFQLGRFPVKGFIFIRQIKKVLFIKKDDKQMIDGFEYRGLPRIIYARSVWDSFNTLDKSLCPKAQKEWVKWEVE